MNSTSKVSFLQKIERCTPIRSVKDGLISIIPILTVGAFALILKTFPVPAYQNAITDFAGGFFLQLFDIIFNATFGVLSVYMTYAISRAYMKIKADEDTVVGGAVVASLISFFILAGTDLPDFGLSCMGPKSIFLAIVTALGASYAYTGLERFLRKGKRALFSSGANREFNRMLSTFMPVAIIVLTVALFDLAVVKIFDVASFRALISRFFDWMFSFGDVGFFKGFFFILLSSVLWLFGIHGSDTLEGVMEKYFTPGLAANQAAVAAGSAPTTVLTKEFFDCFVLMGGCGATICLLIALLIFSKNRARRGLSLTAAFPMIFNINELMVFGLPVILNPVMLIPFLTVPLVCYSISYTAVSTGLVPYITGEVAWTTPVILGGYSATGSAAGAILQVVNIVIGVLIYMPFVRMLDKRTDAEAKRVFSTFMDYFKKNESALATVKLTEKNDFYGDFAKGLCAELRHMVNRGHIKIAYQPQYNYDGKCVGVEALLRCEHSVHGFLYPPLVIKLAKDGGFLPLLEETIIKKVVSEREKVINKFGEGVKISFNVTGDTVVTERFIQILRKINAEESLAGKNLCVEITEQASLAFNENTKAIFEEIHNMGLTLAIDDFSMGQTSINYLKENMFDYIKLDGSLVKGLTTHTNCKEIISSISSLAKTLDISLIAEFVETEEEKEILHSIGCDCYQGYLYSPAVFID